MSPGVQSRNVTPGYNASKAFEPVDPTYRRAEKPCGGQWNWHPLRLTTFLKQLSGWTLATVLISAFLFGLGLFLGVSLGGLNTEIDFCADATSGRYIFDESVRSDVCDGQR